ncbi:adenine deaminase C-terminal domain-containing protein [Effusibacillus lacus]|uniref:adenine deaminase n=1 Tax=Effusibacillus lacus TaxID=1348429 RepID=A0A292YMU3_9BACL|nr:adenine deaminase C-terminal domain-containing protein [Effusibacillus lacus]TCS72315.1 adenine deaminase [Effusibacillus lacus]GAX90219.1 adenine deaminase [Effusibacillus lacus]
MQKRLRPLTIDSYFPLLGVGKGKVKADLYLRGAKVINVYTGEVQTANVAVKGKHIAYVGPSEEMVGPSTEVVELEGRFLCPGYIEPHCHPFQVYNPDSLARFVLPHGTTTMVNDNMGLYMLVGADRFLRMIEEMGSWPVKMLWSVRLDPQTHSEELDKFFTPDLMKQLVSHPLVVQSGELTAWPQLLGGDMRIAENILETLRIGKRLEGHLPGASLETLSMLAAAGVSADHEAMTAEEALRRLRIGLWTTLRYSSLRPDLPEIVRGLAGYKGDTKRMMMTTDGATPAFLKDGFTDHMLKVAMESGMDPMTAYQLVTINPATYYGLDGEVGGIAPGRLADILVLEDLDRPTPVAVLAEGKWAAREGRLLQEWPQLDWEGYGLQKIREEWRMSGDDFAMKAELPVIRLENPAITRLEPLPDDGGGADPGGADGIVHAALIGQDGSWIVESKLSGLADRLDGIASSYTASDGIVAAGQNREAMAQAVNRVLEIGGGIVIVEDGKILFELEMPIAGGMAVEDMETVIRKVEHFEQLLYERGHPHYDPIYTFLFISSTHLPEVRLTAKGVLHVKSGKILNEPKRVFS